MTIEIKRTIQRSSKDSAGFSVVLCEVGGVHKYVTWLVDAENNKHHGDYCASFKDAMESYFDRCRMNKLEA